MFDFNHIIYLFLLMHYRKDDYALMFECSFLHFELKYKLKYFWGGGKVLLKMYWLNTILALFRLSDISGQKPQVSC